MKKDFLGDRVWFIPVVERKKLFGIVLNKKTNVYKENGYTAQEAEWKVRKRLKQKLFCTQTVLPAIIDIEFISLINKNQIKRK